MNLDPLRSGRLFNFGGDKEFLRQRVVLDLQNIRLAADLAVFYVLLAASGGLVDGSRVPYSAGGALEAGFHECGPSTENIRR